MLSVLFRHPRACFLEPFHEERARALNLKYIKAAFVQTEEGVAVRTTQVRFNGQRTTQQFDTFTLEPDTLVNLLAASLDLVYDETFHGPLAVESESLQSHSA